MSRSLKAILLITLMVGVHLKGITIPVKKQTVSRNTTESGFLSMADTKKLGNSHNASYYGEIGFGKNPNTGEINWAPVVFDSGSSWLWVSTEGCQCDGAKSGVYINLQDTDFQSSNQEVTLRYGSGQGEGELGTMTIYLTEDVSYEHQYMVGMTKDSGFGDSYASGIFGLSHKAGSDNYPTLIDNLYSTGAIDQKVFTVTLRDENEQSSITIGEVAYTNVKPGSQFNYVDLNLSSYHVYYYTFMVDEIHLGSTTVSNHYAVADTGTSLIALPTSIATPFFSNSAFSNCAVEEDLHICECGNESDFPTLSFSFGGQTYDVTPQDYLIETQGYCLVGIQPFPTPGGLIILGDVFLRTVVAVFDLQNETIGFAPAVPAN